MIAGIVSGGRRIAVRRLNDRTHQHDVARFQGGALRIGHIEFLKVALCDDLSGPTMKIIGADPPATQNVTTVRAADDIKAITVLKLSDFGAGAIQAHRLSMRQYQPIKDGANCCAGPGFRSLTGESRRMPVHESDRRYIHRGSPLRSL